MKKISYIVILIASILGLQCCISFNTTGLKYLSKEQQERIARPEVPLDQLPVNDTIYVVNDLMVKQWLANKDYAIVHSYLTWCKGPHCINPAIVVKNLEETGLPFLMIAGDFESKNGYRANHPFMCIDFEYYQTKNYSKGIEKMYRALGCGDNWSQLYALFHNGQCVGTADTLSDLMTKYRLMSKDLGN